MACRMPLTYSHTMVECNLLHLLKYSYNFEVVYLSTRVLLFYVILYFSSTTFQKEILYFFTPLHLSDNSRSTLVDTSFFANFLHTKHSTLLYNTIQCYTWNYPTIYKAIEMSSKLTSNYVKMLVIRSRISNNNQIIWNNTHRALFLHNGHLDFLGYF